MSTTTTLQAPELVAGTWNIDPAHSEVGFSVRHLMVSKVKGRFNNFSGAITISPAQHESSVEASIEAASIDTREEQRDGHLRSPDFLDVERYPEITFKSTSVEERGSEFVVKGNLSIHGVTRPVELDLEFNGVRDAPNFGKRAGFSASTEISRAEFGMEFNMPLPDGGGVVVGDKIKVNLEIEATFQEA